MRRDVRRVPETAHPVDLGRRKIHVRRQLVGEPADLAPAHRVGLAGERERPHAGPADAAGRQMAVDDCANLVGALRRLVDALRIAVTTRWRCGEQLVEVRERRRRAGPYCCATAARSGAISRAPRQRGFETGGVLRDVSAIERIAVRKMRPAARQNSAVSMPGLIARCRSASSAVAVRRGSITTSFAPRARRFSCMRRNSTGWHHAAFEPTSTIRSA